MDKLVKFIATRQSNFNFLSNHLADLSGDLILPQATANSVPSWFGFPITLRDHVMIERANLLAELEKSKIGTRLLFAGNIIHQPYMKGRNFRISGELTNSDVIMNRTFWIGLHPSLTHEMLEYVASVLRHQIKVSKI